MAKKDENLKNTTKSENDQKYEVVKEVINYDNTPILNKIVICLYIIIGLLAISIIMTAINLTGDTNNTTNNTKKTTTTTVNENYDVSSFKQIDEDEFVEAYKGKDVQLIYLGRPNCGFCVKFVPILTEVQENYDFTPLYVDINTVTDANKIIELNEEFFTDDETEITPERTAYGYTPMTLIVKNGEILDYQIGLSDYSSLEKIVSKYFDKK